MKTGLLGMLGAMNYHSRLNTGNRMGAGKIKTENFTRPCLDCGRKHNHNNAFCRASCHRNWKLNNPNNGQILISKTPIKAGIVEHKHSFKPRYRKGHGPKFYCTCGAKK